GIIGVAVFAKNSQNTDPVALPSGNPSAALPTGVLPTDDAHAYGVPYGTGTADVPVLEIWEDFQCPACDAVEKANGAGIESLADSGKIRLIWRTTTFLDGNLGNDSSTRAAAAWGCAIDAGKAKEYHNVVFANQPETEGTGYTDEQLLAFAGEVGITGAALDTFTTCVADRTYFDWTANSTGIFYSSNIQGTPFALLNGVEVPTETLVDQPALEKLVADAAAAPASPAAAASPSPAAS
ncbi:MAG: thioredoxin domain-containing protein, partial [Actinobacteria bacterium]|nr:thioredoxin domain-containing protein [Actinomycetota bacterium]